MIAINGQCHAKGLCVRGGDQHGLLAAIAGSRRIYLVKKDCLSEFLSVQA